MASVLKRLAPALRRIEIYIEHLTRESGKGTRRIRLVCKVPAQPSQSSQPSQANAGAGSSRDDSNTSDDSTVTEAGLSSQTVTKNSNEINVGDDCDDCDGSAGNLHTSAKGWKLRL